MFITFTGNDGSGKSSIIKELKTTLESNGQKVIIIKEFNGPIIGTIKNILKIDSSNPSKELVQNRKQKKALYFVILYFDTIFEWFFYNIFFRKYLILKDRYFYDYQATLEELSYSRGLIRMLYNFFPKPWLSIKINVDPKIAAERRINDIRFKDFDLIFHENKHKIYKTILGKYNILYINNNGGINNTITTIINNINLKQKLERISVLKISGIDGAGKSTTIGNIEDVLKSLNISYTQIHFYYNYIPIKLLKIIRKIRGKKEKSTAEHNQASIENEKRSRNKDKSLFWKIYVLADAIIQFSYVNIIGFNKLKIYDRYFLDYKISWDFLGVTYKKGIFDFFGKFSKNYFILGADAETLYKRKPEHTEEFFKETVTAYKKLQTEYKLDFINTGEKNPEQVTEYILNKIQ